MSSACSINSTVRKEFLLFNTKLIYSRLYSLEIDNFLAQGHVKNIMPPLGAARAFFFFTSNQYLFCMHYEKQLEEKKEQHKKWQTETIVTRLAPQRI